jgi:hypothetical protein
MPYPTMCMPAVAGRHCSDDPHAHATRYSINNRSCWYIRPGAGHSIRPRQVRATPSVVTPTTNRPTATGLMAPLLSVLPSSHQLARTVRRYPTIVAIAKPRRFQFQRSKSSGTRVPGNVVVSAAHVKWPPPKHISSFRSPSKATSSELTASTKHISTKEHCCIA